MTKVCALVSTSVRGGGEAYLKMLASRGGPLGLDFTIVGNVPKDMASELDVISVDIGPKWSRSTVLRSALRYRKEMNRYLIAIHDLRPDVFHCQYKREQIGLTQSLSRLGPVIWTEHGEFPGGRIGSLLGQRYRKASESVEKIICVSRKVADSLVSRIGVRESKIVVIENCVDQRFHAISTNRRQSPLLEPGTEVRLVAIGRLEWNKGFDRAIEALGLLPDSYRLAIAGEGSYTGELVSMADRFAPRVEFVGYVRDTVPLLADSDIFLLLSRAEAREGIPLSMLEAIAAGLPVIVSEDSGLKNWSLQHGMMVSGGSLADIAKSVIEVTRDFSSFSQASLTLASKLNPESWLAEHKRTFESLV